MASRTEAVLFEAMVREHSDMLFTYIRGLVRGDLQREEVYQETIVVAWRRLSEYDPERSLGAWLRGIARKIALANVRVTMRHRSLDEAALEQLEAHYAALSRQPGDTFDEKLECLRACVDALADRDREALRARYEDGLRGSDLAAAIGVGVENAKKIVQRARDRVSGCVRTKLGLGEAS